MGMNFLRVGRWVTVAVLLTLGLSACSFLVFLPDAALESAIRDELRKPLSLFLTKADMARVANLDASGMNIRTIEGLQYCVNLRKVNLSDNNIGRIDSLAGLRNLTYLHLGGNRISDIEALAGLLFLEYLNLSGSDNAILDWSYLQDNVVNGGLKAGSVVVVSSEHTLDSTGEPLPGFVSAYNAMLDKGVIVEFRD